MDRKPRGDSILKSLPEDRQREIAELARGGTLAGLRATLAESGIKTSITALSDWLSWYRLRSQFQSWEQDALNMVELLHKKRPDISESDLQAYANELFQLRAIKEGDAETYLAFATARHRANMDRLKFEQREKEIELMRERVELQAEKMREAKEKLVAVASKGGLSEETVRQIEEAAKLL